MTQTLEQLSAAATQGEWSATSYGGIQADGSLILEECDWKLEDALLAVLLVNAFRAGQLVAVADAAIERVARALYEEDDPWHKAWPWPDLQPDQGDPDTYRRLATAAIAAMKDTQP